MKNKNQLSLYLSGGSSSRTPASVDQRPISKLYFAILPDPEIAAQSHRLASSLHRQHRFFAKPRRSDLFHVTLYGIGSFRGLPEETVFAAMEAASRVRKRRCSVTFYRAVSFGKGDNRPLVLWNENGNAELKAIYEELADSMQLTGITPAKEKQVEPHMTLLYRGRVVPDIMLEEPVIWTPKDFVLINSLQGQSIHEHLCYWTLHD